MFGYYDLMRVVLCNIRVKQENWIEKKKGIP